MKYVGDGNFKHKNEFYIIDVSGFFPRFIRVRKPKHLQKDTRK